MTAHDLTHAWLADCANALAQDPARLAHPERWLWGPEAPVSRLRLPLLLVSEGTEVTGELRGHRAWLTLALMPAPGAGLTLAPLPASALLPVDTHWAAVMSELQAGVQGLLSPEGAAASSSRQDWAIGWDVAPQAGEPALASLEGRSAAASLTLGVLWLVRRWLNPSFSASPLWPLACLSQAELERCWVSADVRWPAGQPVLAPVDDRGLVAKAAALARHDPTAMLHTFQAVEGPRARHVKPAADWAGLLAGMGAELGWTPAQAQLLWALLTKPSSSISEALSQTNVLEEVARFTDCSYRQAALTLFARWEQPDEGPVSSWHVPLELSTDEPEALKEHLEAQKESIRRAVQHDNPDSAPNGDSELALSGHRLDELMRYSHPKKAVLLLGAPGAGKTTLLRHRVQTQCSQALQAWDAGLRPSELSLYLPLSELPADQDPLMWARGYLNDSGLSQWAKWALPLSEVAADDPPAWLPKAWRLLCDGLNELPYNTATREERALQVVEALQAALAFPVGEPGSPMSEKPKPLLSIRDQHFRRSEWLCMQVQPWRNQDIQFYLELRFGETGKTRHWRSLIAQPDALELVRNPLMLAGLADLLSSGWNKRLPDNRAQLYAAWLWLRLRRALGVAPSARTRQQSDIDLVEKLLHKEDLAKITDPSFWMEPQHCFNLPLKGPLLSALVRQAEIQYWADHARGKGRESRCKVGVLWWQDSGRPSDYSVSQTLLTYSQFKGASEDESRELCKEWADAIHCLGLAMVDVGPRNTFRFSHQSWGEYLASVRLLELPLNQDEANLQWDRVFNACKPPPDPDPVSELKRLRMNLASRWAETFDARRCRLLASADQPDSPNLRVSWDDFCQSEGLDVKLSPEETPMASLFEKRGRPKAPLMLVCAPDGSKFVEPNLRFFGERYGVSRILRATLGAGRGLWFELAEGWHELLINGKLSNCFKDRVWDWLRQDGVDERLLEDLRRDGGFLPQSSLGDAQEVLKLALLSRRDDQMIWLVRIATTDAWRSAVPTALALRETLEPRSSSSRKEWHAGHWTTPHPLLQFLRKRLLLQSIDTGPYARDRLERSGLLSLLESGQAADGLVRNGQLSPLQIAKLDAAWQSSWDQAFTSDIGVRLQERLQCADWLAELGDNIRFQRALNPAHTDQQGILLRPQLWASVGTWNQPTAFAVGARSLWTSQCPETKVPLLGFRLPVYPTTVMEFQCFVDGDGYDPSKPWWRGEGRAWLLRNGGPARRPWGWGNASHRCALQPVVGLTWWEAQAFTEWARTLRPLGAQLHPVAQGDLCLPSELEIQAAARPTDDVAPWQWELPFNRAELPIDAPLNLSFNHKLTRLGRVSPIGVFSLALSKVGVEQCGNVWCWCRNLQVTSYLDHPQRLRAITYAPSIGPDSQLPRPLMGGSCHDLDDAAQVASRCHDYPGNEFSTSGMRWVLLPPNEVSTVPDQVRS